MPCSVWWNRDAVWPSSRFRRLPKPPASARAPSTNISPPGRTFCGMRCCTAARRGIRSCTAGFPRRGASRPAGRSWRKPPGSCCSAARCSSPICRSRACPPRCCRISTALPGSAPRSAAWWKASCFASPNPPCRRGWRRAYRPPVFSPLQGENRRLLSQKRVCTFLRSAV